MAMARSSNSPKGKTRRSALIEGVVLIHGLGRSHLAMEIMAMRLRADGFTVECVGYHSRGLSLRNAIDAVERQIARVTRGWDVVHLAGHSLGGVIAAAIASKRTRLPVGRVVVFGAPMRGSPLAGLCTRVAPVKAFLGPVLDELAGSEALTAHSPQIGAIAGTGGNRYIGRRIGFSSPYDGKVSVRSAWTGAAHRAAVPVSHSVLPFSRQVAELTAAFFRDGRFPAGMEREA
jgi:pimeloyl-ACP methyl ester carboxylesterase